MRTQTFSSGLNTGSFSLNFGTINFHGGGWCYENFSGKLDDIGIWNRALTPQEITNLYNAQSCQVSVTTQPSNQTATSGQNIQFLTGSSELNSTFQWQSNSGSGFQDVVDGGQYSGSSTSTLSITGLTLQNNNQEFRCIVSAQNCGSDTSDVATLNVTNPNGLTGILMYAHTPASPLVGVPVHLKSYLGYTAASDTTDSTGTYHLVGFPNGNYYLDADINYEVNSINSSDALLAQRFIVMLEMLSNLQQKSADVTGDQRIRTSDALMITRYTASLINQFPVGNFVNTRPDVTASGSVQSVNMLALASGDVNGNLLVQSSPPTLVLDTVYGNGTEGTATVRFTTSGSGIYERGVCWGTSPNPTVDSNKSVAGAGGFGFTHSFGGLTGGTQYYVRAYAINSAGTYYSNEQIFVLLPPPIVSLGQVTGCSGSVVTVPITVGGFRNIGAVTLELNYDASALTYTGFDSSALTGNLIVNNPSVGGVPQGRVLVSWFSLTPANIGSGLLMNLTFTVNGSSSVDWNLAVPGQCELADVDGEVIANAVFTNGSVTSSGGASITSQPASSLPLALGASGSLSVVASGVTAYQWQVRVGGGAWTNLSNGTNYSGVTTSTLGIVASAAMNGNEYRVLVSGGSCPSVTSSVSMLVVSLLPIVSLGHVTGCSGSVISVPITVQNFTNVSAVSLELNYNAAALTYTGFDSSALTGNLIVNNPSVGGVPQGRVLVSWFSLTPANIGSGLLMNLIFTVNGSSTVNWNLAVPGQCELADGDGEVIEDVVFTNGSVTCGSASLPTVTTTLATGITSTGATMGGNVTSDGGAAVTARGVVYGTAQNPTTANSTTSDGTGTGAFNSTLTGLAASTLYYVRAYATNSAGTAYGNEVSFTTSAAGPQPCPGTPTVTDVDNNTYATVQIGTQCWTQSNLKVTKYRNGDNIPTGLSNAQWSSTTLGAYAIYNNDAANDALYGKLYNWYAVTDSRGLCPTGWHVPSDGEWTTLTTFLGGESVAGGAMKSTATQPTPGGWNAPNTGATNSSGFTGLPGGFRDSGGGFLNLGRYGYWWSSSAAGSGSAWYRILGYVDANALRNVSSLRLGFSVRCARD